MKELQGTTDDLLHGNSSSQQVRNAELLGLARNCPHPICRFAATAGPVPEKNINYFPGKQVLFLEALWGWEWGPGSTLAPQSVAGSILVAVRGFPLRNFRKGEKAAALNGVAVRELV